MEGNRDSADLCYCKALDAMKAADVPRAIRMLQKSIRLFETDRAKKLLLQLEKIKNSDSKMPPSAENVRRRTVPESSPTREPVPEPVREYTPQQAEVVHRILTCKKDYYTILGLEKGATEDEVKKAYRKLALKLHPDKNQAPRADEAFKLLGKAFAVLSDKDKRDSYEQYGADGPQIQQNRGGFHHHHGGFYDDDGINPEEIFNMFFGGGMPQGPRVHRRTHFRFNGPRQGQQGQHHESQNNLGVWLQFMPLLVLIGLSLISNLMTPDPAYSLHRYPNRGYGTKIFTVDGRIPYYVKSDFVTEYPPDSSDRKKLEIQVKSEYVENLRINCYQETLNAEQKMRRAQLYRDKKMMEQAQHMARPNCNRLNELTGG